MKYNKIGVIGAGLMGATLIKGLQKMDFAWSIVAIVRNDENVEKLKLESIKASTDYKALEDADIIFIAAPLGAYEEILSTLSELQLRKEVIVSDLGSVKSFAIDLAHKLLPETTFVAAHPIAGSHISGTGVIIDKLYQGKKLIITGAENEASKEIADIWTDIGMEVEYIDARQHDRIYAYVSHLVQKIAFNLNELFFHTRKSIDLLRDEYNSEIFNKFIRLKYSNPKMWDDIFSFNQKYLQEASGNFQAALQGVITRADELIELGAKEALSKNTAKDLDLYSAYFVAEALQSIVANNIDDCESYAGPGFKDFTAILHDGKKELTDLAVGELGFIRDRLSALLNSL